MKYCYLLSICLLASCMAGENSNRFSNSEIQDTRIGSSTILATSVDSVSIIDLSKAFGNGEIRIDSLVDSIKVLPLETSEASVFSGVKKILLSDDRIFILDRKQQVLLFDNAGKFISKINQGQGPGEITQPLDIAFDKANGQLIVYDISDYLKFYDASGNFVSDKKCPIMFDEFCLCDDDYLFFQPEYINKHLGDDGKYAALIANRDLVVNGRGIPVSQHGFVRSGSYIMTDGDRIFISQLGNDTIYSVSNSKVAAKYILKYDDYRADVSDLKEVEYSDKYYHCSGFLENANTQIINLYNPKKGKYVFIRDKTSGAIIGGESFSCDFFWMPLCMPAINVCNGYFVSCFEPHLNIPYKTAAISDFDKKRLSELTLDSNPVILFFKIKVLK